jgi:hypothetical protein
MPRRSRHLLTPEDMQDLHERAREAQERARESCARARALQMRLTRAERERPIRHAKQAKAVFRR